MTTKKISKKQRVALKEIDKITKERKRDLGIGIGAVALMAIFVILFNGLGYNMGFIDPNNVLLRGTSSSCTHRRRRTKSMASDSKLASHAKCLKPGRTANTTSNKRKGAARPLSFTWHMLLTS